MVLLHGAPFLFGNVSDIFVNPVVEWCRRSNQLLSLKTLQEKRFVLQKQGTLNVVQIRAYPSLSCGRRCGSAAAHLSKEWVRIAAGAWISVSCECCVLSGKVSASGWSVLQRSPTDCGVSECYREASIMRTPYSTRGCCGVGKKIIKKAIILI